MRIIKLSPGKQYLLLLLFISNGLLFGQTTMQRLQETTQNFFAERLNVPVADLTITYKHLPRHLENYRQSTIRVFSQRKELKPGYQSLWVSFSSPAGRLQKKVAITADVAVNQKILVAATAIRRGMLMAPGMVRFELRRLGKDWKSYYDDIRLLDGLEAKQTIKNGRALTRRLLRKVPLIHRGDRIKVEVRNSLLSVTTFGTAIQDGFKGSKIKLKLGATGRVVKAEVRNAGLAVLHQ